MAFCLNPDCPHKKKTGHPAEFREGINHCSDCGSLLTEEVIEKEEPQKTPPKIILTDLHKRILYTIILDLMEEMRLRMKGSNLAKIAELHDVPMAGLLKSLFEQKGVTCYLRGYYHRALLYFFGPYIEISVLVPEDRMTDAKEVIENYLDANVLTAQIQ